MLQKLLVKAEELKASDIYISVGLPATLKLNGRLESLTKNSLTQNDVFSLMKEIMGEKRFIDFEHTKEANYAVNSDSAGRFRVSAFMQKEQPGMVIRRIEGVIPSFEELHLPVQLKETCMANRGLILFVGATGSGKSTTQAAMIGYRNQNSSGHILTIEDPIEFVHEHGKSVVTQREVGIDTESFEEALKNSLRQAPDVILIGEIRTRETMEFAIIFAETGHLCMATLHSNNANQALERILHLVPKERHRQFLFDLSVNLRAIVAQQLIPTSDGKSRRAAFEILYNTPTMAEAIRKGELHHLKDIMKSSSEHGMQTFDQALFNLYEQGVIGYTEALAHADSANDVRLMIKLDSTEGRKSFGTHMLDDITLDY
ncbi:type IV pili twitching motility protein PilT [Psychromonas sp. psych-6C06]|uniref:PilT/PilU family type 4a pilus ATPase n=1 Tax=Psychromonas sp. psych-6C06 TaxID=2058089 RepID=UPI000C340032|nr:PilT/PilU family type 4a pilus ATPase [Psychromonas sp. psych-6C06]PKF63088.1 type IV pili twitching motility protein PilT [Psychromonas sp. psych-6C06]